MKYFLVSYLGQKTQGMALYSTDDKFFFPNNFIIYIERRTGDRGIVPVNYKEITQEHNDYIIQQGKAKKDVPQGK